MKNQRHVDTPPPVRQARAASKDFKRQVEQATAGATLAAEHTESTVPATKTPPSTKKSGHHKDPSTVPSMVTVVLTQQGHLAHRDDSAGSEAPATSGNPARFASNDRNKRVDKVDQNCQCLIL
jgi:hypothetical protein